MVVVNILSLFMGSSHYMSNSNNGSNKITVEQKVQVQINKNLTRVCEMILLNLDVINARLDIILERIKRLETSAKRSEDE